MTLDVLKVEKIDGVMLLTLNRPEVRNALSSELAQALLDAVQTAVACDQVHAVILAGDRHAFSAGTDLKQRRSLTAEEKWRQSRTLWNLAQEIARSPKVVVAAIDGWCLGGGFELALACDLRIAAPEARFGWPEMTLGVYPGAGAAVLLPRIVGIARAKSMFFTARRFDAAEALAIGLVGRVVPGNQLIDAALAWVDALRHSPSGGIAAAKRSIDNSAGSMVDIGPDDQPGE
jgi:enoyl-CoA hydratase/carnithine racemase